VSGTLANEAYVDAAVVGLADLKGGYNASTNTPDLDSSPSGIKKGDTYRVTAGGSFFAVVVEIGDTLIAEQDDPVDAGDWIVLQTNLDGAALASGGLDQFSATTSAELAGVISDETGSGLLVFATSPTLITPTLGVASATSINKVTITAPTTAATLTLADGSSFITSGGHSITLTSAGATSVTLPSSGTLATLAGTETFTNKTISSATNTIDGGTI
jgi:hypothetical protein